MKTSVWKRSGGLDICPPVCSPLSASNSSLYFRNINNPPGRCGGTSIQMNCQALREQNSYNERFPGVLSPKSLRSLHIKHAKQFPRRRGVSPMEPMFCGFQLVGDSMLLRFAEQILDKECINADHLRYIGLCVSGQTIEQLRRRVESGFAALGDKIILLIGTNDLLQGRDIGKMKLSFDWLVDILQETVQRLIILTIPPIPKLEDDKQFRMKFAQFNEFLKLFPRKYANTICIDTTSLFQCSDKNSNIKYFERWYDILQNRSDLVHLNHAGLVLVRDRLLQNDFQGN